VVGGLLLFVAGSWVLYNLFGHVQARVDNWLDPWRDPQGAGFQVVQALYAFGRGGILGVGLGAGLPTIGGRLPVPAVHTDYPLAALGEELGLIGLLAILGLYLVVVSRGLRIAAAAHDDFRALLAAGLALVIGTQAFIIAAGNLKLIPLTGITLPLISYGGSSLLANAVVVGLLLALSDRGIEPPPAPRDRPRRWRLLRRGEARP
jgi:cell division protein FtsW (lipid II flippase)